MRESNLCDVSYPDKGKKRIMGKKKEIQRIEAVVLVHEPRCGKNSASTVALVYHRAADGRA